MLEIILLSITQGITEFLPISSSAHLILISQYLKLNSENLTLDISLHLGSLIAVIIFFKNEILNFIQNKNLFIKIIFGSIPTIVVGYFLTISNLNDLLRSNNIIALSTILFGVLLYLSDQSKTNKNISDDLTLRLSFYIGLFQILSLISGVSRSGITMTGARFLKFNRIDFAKISFLYSIPTLCAVGFYGIWKIIDLKNLEITALNFWSIILSFIFSLITLKFFINFLKKFSLFFFMVYRTILGILILIYIYG